MSSKFLKSHANSIKWHHEHSIRVNRICQCIQRRVQNGQKLHKAFVYFTWYYRARNFVCAPARPVRLSYPSIRRHYYQWLAAGQSVQAVSLRYPQTPRKLDRHTLRRFLRAAVSPGVMSLYQAHAAMVEPVATPSAFNYALAPHIRKELLSLFRLRRRQLAAERRIHRRLN